MGWHGDPRDPLTFGAECARAFTSLDASMRRLDAAARALADEATTPRTLTAYCCSGCGRTTRSASVPAACPFCALPRELQWMEP